MRIAIISDVHADLHALTDAIAQAQRNGCDLIVCAGDIVDGGLFPQETIELLIEKSIPCIRGNHDRWAIGLGRADAPFVAEGQHSMRDATGWDLSRAAFRFLTKLPTHWSRRVGTMRIAMHHARPDSDMHGIYPDQLSEGEADALLHQADADVLIVGHTHIPFVLRTSRGGLIVNPGALFRDAVDSHELSWLMDKTGKLHGPGVVPIGGTFAVLDLSTNEVEIHNTRTWERPT